jgi:hypothetical protein
VVLPPPDEVPPNADGIDRAVIDCTMVFGPFLPCLVGDDGKEFDIYIPKL